MNRAEQVDLMHKGFQSSHAVHKRMHDFHKAEAAIHSKLAECHAAAMGKAADGAKDFHQTHIDAHEDEMQEHEECAKTHKDGMDFCKEAMSECTKASMKYADQGDELNKAEIADLEKEVDRLVQLSLGKTLRPDSISSIPRADTPSEAFGMLARPTAVPRHGAPAQINKAEVPIEFAHLLASQE